MGNKHTSNKVHSPEILPPLTKEELLSCAKEAEEILAAAGCDPSTSGEEKSYVIEVVLTPVQMAEKLSTLPDLPRSIQTQTQMLHVLQQLHFFSDTFFRMVLQELFKTGACQRFSEDSTQMMELRQVTHQLCSNSQIEERFSQAFLFCFDTDGNEEVSMVEFIVALCSWQRCFSRSPDRNSSLLLDRLLFRKMDTDLSGSIDLTEVNKSAFLLQRDIRLHFCLEFLIVLVGTHQWTSFTGYVPFPKWIKRTRPLFSLFDKQWQKFEMIYSQHQKEILAEWLQRVDLNNDSSISFDEFVRGRAYDFLKEFLIWVFKTFDPQDFETWTRDWQKLCSKISMP